MTSQHDVDAIKQAGANVIGLGSDQLLGHAGVELQSARQLVLFHHLLKHKGGGDVDGQTRIVSFAVARSSLYYRVVVGNTRFLRSSRNAIDVADEADDRLPSTP